MFLSSPSPPGPAKPVSKALPEQSTPNFFSLSSKERHVLVFSTVLKALLFPCYRSTDFEVHRNWLAITRSLPLSEWYFENASQWTLDYPPFFAYFEWFLSRFAFLVDPAITDLKNLGYSAPTAVAFQRATVVLSELVLGAALLRFARTMTSPDSSTAFLVATSVFLHPGLLIVDHIHFQYNGFLLGVLVWSLVAAKEGRLLLCGFLFAALLNFKHIFIYLAPPYFVFLLRRWCFVDNQFRFERFYHLAVMVLGVFILSFGPFVLVGGFAQLRQILSRLFPFQRGLNHAYWAGNFWALMTALDRVLVKYLSYRGWPVNLSAINSTSRGLVGDTTFGVLPTISPQICFAITASFMMIYLVPLWKDPTFDRFVSSIVLSAFTSFLFGWHVHEKAALLFLIPMSFVALKDVYHLRVFAVASFAGIYGLFPLLIHSAETPIKLLYSIVWGSLVLRALRRVVYRPTPTTLSILTLWSEYAYMCGFGIIQLYVSVLHPLLFPATQRGTFEEEMAANSTVSPEPYHDTSEKSREPTMEFLPLLLQSVWCALGNLWAWINFSIIYLSDHP